MSRMANNTLMNHIVSLRWRLNRFRTMGMSEIFWRIKKASSIRLEKLGIGRVHNVCEPSGRAGVPWFEVSPAINPQIYLSAADKILAGYYDIFSLESANLGFPPSWNRDPRTGTIAPLRFGKTLNYRNETIVGDIKYLWEPNRHLELVTLAEAYYLTSDMSYAQGVKTLLESWFEQCPYPLGPNWTSSLEHAVRIVNWSVTWHLLGGDDSLLFRDADGPSFRKAWLRAIFLHLHFIRGHFSRYSSANNHLLGEYMGLFIGSITWPLWEASEVWRNLAYTGFEEEALKQSGSDGVNLEQGIWYHHEVVDMMLICGLIGKSNGVDFSSAYWKRLEAMLEYVAAVMDVDGHVPMIGDSDDAVMVRLTPEKANVYCSLLATGAVLFKRGDFKAKAGYFDDKSRWLLGREGEELFNNLPVPSDDLVFRRAFQDGGYYVLGANLDTPEEIRIVADAGPLGYLSIAAHGHADALSFTLFVAGNEILIDPGTYAYHTQKKWRDYFRSTSAHNTVRVDGVNQSISGGNFLWLRHAKARCTEFETGGQVERWVGEHDGYTRLVDPVVHRRVIEYDHSRHVIRVRDILKCHKKHSVEIFWHFAESCSVTVTGGSAIAVAGQSTVRMHLQDSCWAPQYMEGNDELPQGWISRRFDEKFPAPCIIWSGEITGNTELVTELQIHAAS